LVVKMDLKRYENSCNNKPTNWRKSLGIKTKYARKKGEKLERPKIATG
jgi:hypothetical protein